MDHEWDAFVKPIEERMDTVLQGQPQKLITSRQLYFTARRAVARSGHLVPVEVDYDLPLEQWYVK